MALKTTQPKAIAPSKFESELITMDKGVQANVPAGTTLMVNGVAQKQAVIDQALQGWITIFEAVDTAQAAYKEAVAARVAITVAARTYYKSLKAAIKQYFGAESTLLPSFGITADKASTATAQQKLVAAAKRKQTGTVRGTTLSKKQKSALTVVGNPPITVPTSGPQQISPPPVNVGGINTPSSTPSSTSSSTPSSTPSNAATPAPAGSGSGSGTPTPGSSTPAGA